MKKITLYKHGEVTLRAQALDVAGRNWSEFVVVESLGQRPVVCDLCGDLIRRGWFCYDLGKSFCPGHIEISDQVTAEAAPVTTTGPDTTVARHAMLKFIRGDLTWHAYHDKSEDAFTLEESSGRYLVNERRDLDKSRDPENRGPWLAAINVDGAWYPFPRRFEYWEEAVRYCVGHESKRQGGRVCA